jgi:DnaJ-domain-containing protein 1
MWKRIHRRRQRPEQADATLPRPEILELLEVDTPVLEQLRQRALADEQAAPTDERFYHALRERAERLAARDVEGDEWRPAEYGPTSFYLLLGVTRDAPMWRVERAYKRYVAANHPDRCGGDPERKRECEQRLSEMNVFMAKLRAYHRRRRAG